MSSDFPGAAASFRCSHDTRLPSHFRGAAATIPKNHAPTEWRGYNAASAGNTIRNSAPPRGEWPISSWPLWFSMVVSTI